MIAAQLPTLITDQIRTAGTCTPYIAVPSLFVTDMADHFCLSTRRLCVQAYCTYYFSRKRLPPRPMPLDIVAFAAMQGITGKGIIGDTTGFTDNLYVRYS